MAAKENKHPGLSTKKKYLQIPKKAKKIEKPAWNGTVSDLSVHTASPDQITRRHVIHQSKNLEWARTDLMTKDFNKGQSVTKKDLKKSFSHNDVLRNGIVPFGTSADNHPSLQSTGHHAPQTFKGTAHVTPTPRPLPRRKSDLQLNAGSTDLRCSYSSHASCLNESWQQKFGSFRLSSATAEPFDQHKNSATDVRSVNFDLVEMNKIRLSACSKGAPGKASNEDLWKLFSSADNSNAHANDNEKNATLSSGEGTSSLDFVSFQVLNTLGKRYEELSQKLVHEQSRRNELEKEVTELRLLTNELTREMLKVQALYVIKNNSESKLARSDSGNSSCSSAQSEGGSLSAEMSTTPATPSPFHAKQERMSSEGAPFTSQNCLLVHNVPPTQAAGMPGLYQPVEQRLHEVKRSDTCCARQLDRSCIQGWRNQSVGSIQAMEGSQVSSTRSLPTTAIMLKPPTQLDISQDGRRSNMDQRRLSTFLDNYYRRTCEDDSRIPVTYPGRFSASANYPGHTCPVHGMQGENFTNWDD